MGNNLTIAKLVSKLLDTFQKELIRIYILNIILMPILKVTGGGEARK